MEQLDFVFDPGLSWDDPGSSNCFGDGVFDFDSLAFPELSDFTLEECLREPPEHRQSQTFDQTVTEIGFSDDSTVSDIWTLISAELELNPVLQTSTMEDATSHGSPTWTSSPTRSTFTQSSTGQQTAWTSPTFTNTSPVLPDMHLNTPPLHMSHVHVNSHMSHITATAATAAIFIMPESPEPSPAASTAHNPRQRRNTRRQERKEPHAIPARELRKQTKPVKCPICDHGHAYTADLRKHIASNHPERAHEFQVPTARTPCTMCSRTFARRDHYVRHCRTKHGGRST